MQVTRYASGNDPSAQDVAEKLGSARGNGAQWYGRCPAHDDENASLSLTNADDGALMVHCHAGCASKAIYDALRARGLLEDRQPIAPPAVPRRTIVASYDYCDEHGVLLYQKQRFAPKGFRQRKPEGDGWSYRLGDVRRVLYRLPELAASPTKIAFVVEGEKDADALRAGGRLATCNDSGAGKWTTALTQQLGKRRVMIVADNDVPGRDHARIVCDSLTRAGCHCWIVEFTELPEHADVSDWLQTHTVEQITSAALAAKDSAAAIQADGLCITPAAQWAHQLSRNLEPPKLRVVESVAPEPSAAPVVERHDDEQDQLRLLARYSDDQLAAAFIESRLDGLRYVHDWGQWIVWDGTRWEVDKTAEITSRVRIYCREVGENVANDVTLKAPSIKTTLYSLGSVKVQRSLELMARADRHIGIRHDTLDCHPLLLATPKRVLDLETGATVTDARNRMMTKVTRVDVADEVSGPWCDFVLWCARGDPALAQYLQRVAGYCLTGLTREQCMFFLYGPGANGKGIFMNTLQFVLGDYARATSTSTFMEGADRRHSTEIARLHGARLVTASESDRDRAWSEARIKTMTGGDRLTARFMRADDFEFDPQFKILMGGNYLPTIRNVDVAMRRRVKIVPFMAKLTEPEKDLTLGDKMRSEAPGILRWCIDGCMQWLRDGMVDPPAVVRATSEYFTEEDAVLAFLQTRMQALPGSSVLVKIAYAKYAAHCKASGEAPMTSREFVRALRGHDVLISSDSRGASSMIGYAIAADSSHDLYAE